MANVTFKKNATSLSGDLPAVGSTAPDFNLVASGLKDVTLADYAGKTPISPSPRGASAQPKG
jgi:thiol peroxidase